MLPALSTTHCHSYLVLALSSKSNYAVLFKPNKPLRWPSPHSFSFVRYKSLAPRNYSSLRGKPKKVKESIGSKLKAWSEKGLLMSAAQLEPPVIVDTSDPKIITAHPSITKKKQETSSLSQDSYEIQLKEYVQLCKEIIEGKTPPSTSKSNQESKRKKPAQKTVNLDTNKQSSDLIISSTATEVTQNFIETSLEALVIPKGTVSDKVTTRRTRKSKEATASVSTEEKSSILAQNLARPATLPSHSADLPPLPLNWQHEYEQDLRDLRARMKPLIQEFDESLRNDRKFDRHAPLGFLQLRFWQSRFEWDHIVENAASKYVSSALISKQHLDPAFKPPESFASSAPIEFKALQREAINIVLSRKSMFVALPTGGGKTMCYVLPALLERGFTVVVSPLIALIQDQVTLLESMGIGAAGLSSQMSPEQLESIYNQLLDDSSVPPFKLIYVTPERIGRNERFVNILMELNQRGMLQRIVVDEAHCISEWGHDFRKDYRRLGILKELMPDIPIMAVTGTCTPTVRKDIAEQLKIDTEHYCLQTSFNRPNLWFQISKKSIDTPMADMLYYILNHGLANECGIIFAMTTNDAERLAEFFSQQGLLTTFYHGGMTAHARQEAHSQWNQGRAKLMCTTVAFGLGIDKSNVRYVLHSTMPTSLETYYQQMGRAGRDGNPADCILFFHPKDRLKIEHVIRLNAHLLKKRQKMQEFARLQAGAVKSGRSGKKKTMTAQQEIETDVNIVDIADIDEGAEKGIIRLIQEDGSEIMFDCGSHPDYGIESLEEDPVDIFVRQMKTEKLDDVTSYCKEKKTCRRVHLMRFFGQPFVSHQCHNTCDICAPQLQRVTDRLNKRGQKEWATLAEQRARVRAESPKPLNPTVAKIHDLIHAQEQEFAEKEAKKARMAEEEAYEKQFDRVSPRSRQPYVPSSVGIHSPLARKQRRRAMSSLGDPSNYDLFTEHMEKSSRMALEQLNMEDVAIVSKPNPTTLLSFSELKEKFLSRPRPMPSSTSSAAAGLSELTPLGELHTTKSDGHDSKSRGSPPPPENGGLNDILDSIARVTERKLAIRTQKKLKSRSSFIKKRHLIQEESEDGYTRTHMRYPSNYGIGEHDQDDELQEEAQIVNNRRTFQPKSLPSSESLITSTDIKPFNSSVVTGKPSKMKQPLTNNKESENIESVEEERDTKRVKRPIVDAQLLYQVRQVCKQIKEELNIPPSVILSQTAMKEVANVKPKTVAELAHVRGVGHKRATRFASYLLPIFKDVEDI